MGAATKFSANSVNNDGGSGTKSRAQALMAESEASLKAMARLRSELLAFVLDKPASVDVTLCALLSSGHLLLEDVPGIGKTTFIKAVSRLVGLTMKRVQFTSDLLPTDIIGLEVFDSVSGRFAFHSGPIFTHILLADELNRASPRTQSALLEAMGEGSVTVDGNSHELPQPFLVFATQNPTDNVGTYPLPESQLDRFAARLKLDYPSPDREREIFRAASADPIAALPQALVSLEMLRELQRIVDAVYIADRVVHFAKRVVDESRRHGALRLGVSTRGGVTWLRMARARALLEGRSYVTPDDLVALAIPCLAHRVTLRGTADAQQIMLALVASVDVE